MIASSPFDTIFGATPAGGGNDPLLPLVRSAVRAGYAIVACHPETKQPMCTLSAREAKAADTEAQELARLAGHRRWEKVRHACGIREAITDAKTADKVIKRIEKNGDKPNIGIELGKTRVHDDKGESHGLLVVDVDTAEELAAFRASWDANTDEPFPAMTVSSPGRRDDGGTWVHKGGGHFYFWLPAAIADKIGAYGSGVLKVEGAGGVGWSAMWKDRQVLVPPSARTEGPYQITGNVMDIPEWLLRVVATHVKAWSDRAKEQAERRERNLAERSGEQAAIDEWAAQTSWHELLEAADWVETGDASSCGCPEYTAPPADEHASPKSATAHELGCSEYDDTPGHCPLHIWTDAPPAGFAQYLAAGTRTFTKIQFLAVTRYGSMTGAAVRQVCRDEGLRAEGGESAGLTALGQALFTGRGEDHAERKTAPAPPPPPLATEPESGEQKAGGSDPLSHGESDEGPSAPPPQSDHSGEEGGDSVEDFLTTPFHELDAEAQLHITGRRGKLAADMWFDHNHSDQVYRQEEARALRIKRAREEADRKHRAEKYPHAAALDAVRPVSAVESRQRFLANRGKRTYLIESVVPEATHGALGARDKAGKSFLLIDAAVNVAAGGKWLNKFSCQAGRVLVFWTEGGEDEWNDRFEAVCSFFGYDPDAVAANIEVQFSAPVATNPESVSRFYEDVYRFRPHLVLLDTWHSAAGEADGQKLSESYSALNNFSGITTMLGSAMWVFTHHKKTAEGKNGTGDWSGAGLAEWARWRINLTGESEDASEGDPTGRTTADLALEMSGMVSGTYYVHREVWRDNRADLSSPMHYRLGSDPSARIRAIREAGSGEPESPRDYPELFKQLVELIRDYKQPMPIKAILEGLDAPESTVQRYLKKWRTAGFFRGTSLDSRSRSLFYEVVESRLPGGIEPLEYRGPQEPEEASETADGEKIDDA